ncbi:MAG: phosphopantetheine-binding protein [Desulfobacterales bacterium]|jgi:acyl carrier protein
MDLLSELKEMIVNTFAIDGDAVVADAHLQDDLGADSLAVVRLAEAIGTHYGIEILAEDLLDVANVGEIVALVKSRIS